MTKLASMSVPDRRELLGKISEIPCLPLGLFPTPVRQVDLARDACFWLKDDGMCSDVYAGNKVRKLEYLFAHAIERKRKELVVYGDEGSHNLMACALWGKRLGFKVDVIGYSFKPNEFDDLPLSEIKGINLIKASNFLGAILKYYSHCLFRRKLGIPLGCTTPRSVVGYVKAVIELQQQIEDGELPLPDIIFVACGTGGTVAGLLIGLSLLDLPVKVIAVQSVNDLICNENALKKMISRTLHFLGFAENLSDLAMSHLEKIDRQYLGKGYRDLPESAIQAVNLMKARGLQLEPVFTGKAMAALIDQVESVPSGKMLFWNTHSQRAFQQDAARPIRNGKGQ